MLHGHAGWEYVGEASGDEAKKCRTLAKPQHDQLVGTYRGAWTSTYGLCIIARILVQDAYTV